MVKDISMTLVLSCYTVSLSVSVFELQSMSQELVTEKRLVKTVKKNKCVFVKLRVEGTHNSLIFELRKKTSIPPIDCVDSESRVRRAGALLNSESGRDMSVSWGSILLATFPCAWAFAFYGRMTTLFETW